MPRFEKLWALSGAEKRTVMVALSGLPMVTMRLRILGFKNYLARLQRTPLADSHPEIVPSTFPAQTSRLVNAAARSLFRREACLDRSIMLWLLLRRKGIESDLKIGVATENKGIRAHVWVEVDDEAVNERPRINEQFTAFNSSLTADYRDFS